MLRGAGPGCRLRALPPPDRLAVDSDADEVRSGSVPAVIWSRARRAGVGGLVVIASRPVSHSPALAPAVRLLSCPGVDDVVELVRIDRHRRSADRRVGRRDPQPGSRRDPSTKPAEGLFRRALAPLADRHQALVPRQGRTGDEHQGGREPVADSPSVPRVGDGLDASDQAREIRGVEVDLCHRGWAPRVCQHGMVEGASEYLSRPPVQCSDVDVLHLAMGDVATGATPEAFRLTEPQERRGAVTGPEVTRRVHERLDQKDWVAPGLHPVSRESPEASRHHRGRGVLPATGWQDAKPLVRGDEPEPAQLGLCGPADEAITRSTRQCRRCEADERDPLVLDGRDVAQHPAEEVVPQEVVLVEQRVEPGDLVGAHEAHGQISSLLPEAQTSLGRCCVSVETGVSAIW